jgi:signal transduction histidine kinase
MFRELERYQYVVDGAIAVAYFVATYLVFGFYYYIGLDWVESILVVGTYALAVGLRRVSPGPALAVAWLASFAQMAFEVYPNLFNVATLLVLFTTAAYGSRLVRNAGLVSVVLGSGMAAAWLSLQGAGLGVSETLFGAVNLPGVILQFVLLFAVLSVILGSSWLAGLLLRAMIRTRESRLARDQAEQVVIVEQERNRIARDMHDVVAHSLAVVIAQSDGARYARATDPEAVDEALLAISTTARDALADVRLLLGQLRHTQAAGPQPVLADLDHLLDQLRSSGLSVTFQQNGMPRPLGTAQELSIYRIVQEAVTNALRHGDRASDALVRFDWHDDRIDITITNGLTVPTTTAQLHIGHGLAGMTERAALVGGRLRAEPAGERFVVTASLPTASTHPAGGAA